MPNLDLNCDLGESPHDDPARDDALAMLVTSLNVACGGYAGDPHTIERLARCAVVHGKSMGAHPGYPDPRNFGRVPMAMTPVEVERSLRLHLTTFARICSRIGVPVAHVKPHGALYHAAMHDEATARAIASAVRETCPGAALVGMAGAPALDVWRSMGMAVQAEGFADRQYASAISLAPRSSPHALLGPDVAAAQALAIARGDAIRGVDGTAIRIPPIHTLCIHSDTPESLACAAHVVDALTRAGIEVCPPHR